jgi:hypothetical protein
MLGLSLGGEPTNETILTGIKSVLEYCDRG